MLGRDNRDLTVRSLEPGDECRLNASWRKTSSRGDAVVNGE